MTEDAFQGDARFTVAVDGVQVGGVETATQTRTGPGPEDFTFPGNWGSGQHSVAVYWTFTAPHCDGFTASQGTSCLPAGKTLVKQISFTVVPTPQSNQGA